MTIDLPAHFAAHGCQARAVPVQHLADLQTAIQDLRDRGLLDPDVYRTYLSAFTFTTAALPGARSLIVVAVPQPPTRVTFAYQGRQLDTLIPPTYLMRQAAERAGDLLADLLAPAGYHFVPASLPKKLLAACCGLARYGRNNLAYVDGMGSFAGLVAFLSDLPPADDPWQAPQMLDLCRTCKACRRRCPTGAIDERFLVYAERCITFHNEKPSTIAFPDWLDPAGHNCLVGCMHCQSICPENRCVRDRLDFGPRFDEDETALLLADTEMAQLPAVTRHKLVEVEMDVYISVLARNLRALLAVSAG